MSTSVASELETPRPSRRSTLEKAAIVAAKLLVTGACFWYVSRQIDWRQVSSAVPLLELRWAALAIFVIMLEIPRAGLRWYNIVDAVATRGQQLTRAAMTATTSVRLFFAQVLQHVPGGGMRPRLLVRLGSNWRTAVTSVVIDRAVGVGLLIVLGFVVLLLPSGLTALGGYRDVVLIVYGALILAGALGLLLAPKIASPLARWRYSRWFATLAADVHRVVFGSKGPVVLSIGCLIEAFTIVVVWSLGRAQGLALPLPDAMVLFVVMVGVVAVPISVGGWGLRELAVVSLLGAHGVAPEKALLFSVCFGLALAIGSLPGGLAWILFPFPSARRSVKPPAPEVFALMSTRPRQ